MTRVRDGMTTRREIKLSEPDRHRDGLTQNLLPSADWVYPDKFGGETHAFGKLFENDHYSVRRSLRLSEVQIRPRLRPASLFNG
jgi:hypothetical protein